MELNAKILFHPSGSYEIAVEEGKDSGFFLSVSEAELKRMGKTYAEKAKAKKEALKKEVEASKVVGKKAKVRAFLKKSLAKRKSAAAKNPIKVLEEYIRAGTSEAAKDTKYASWGSRSGMLFIDTLLLEMKPEYKTSPIVKALNEWFLRVLCYGDEKKADYEQAPEDFINDIVSGILKAMKKPGKMVAVWEQDVEPPYGSRVDSENLEDLKDVFPKMDVEGQVDFESNEDEDDGDYEDQPYHYTVFVSFPK